jgi:hypothetical protein
MNKNAAMARLGLTGTEDVNSITRAYSDRLDQAQQQLLASQTSAARQHSQTQMAELVEAYGLLTGMQRASDPPVADNATVIRPPGESDTLAASATPALVTNPGMVLAERLEIGPLLGHGGMGNVYAAHDRLKDEDIAIKVLRQDLSMSVAAKERFLAEAKVSCSLSHPNIIRVHDVGISGGHYYFSMERLKGQTLRQYMQLSQRSKRKLTLDEILGMVRQLFEALEYAHRYIVHRDLKPENIWLSQDGTVKLMDFGIARAYSHSQITKTGMTLGTAYYMAPEQQTAAQEVDWRADQYSMGVVLYEMLAGTVPMGAARPLGQLRRDLPKRAAKAIMRALAPNPADRWPSLDALSEELHAPPRSISKVAVAVLAVFAAVAGGKLAVDNLEGGELMPVATSTLAATTLTAATIKLATPEIVPPADGAVLPEPGLFDIVDADSGSTARSLEAEVIETEFIEPERIQPQVQKAVIQPAVPVGQVVREVAQPVQIQPHPEPRFDPRRPPPDLRPPPPRGTRPPPHPDFRHPPPPPRRR